MVSYIWRAIFFSLMWLCDDVASKRNHTLKPRVVLPENYVKEMRPPARKGQPVIVEFSIYVVDVNSINVEDMDFRVDMFIRQTWRESRLQLPEDIFEEGDDHVTLPPEFFDNLWHPDPYFLNSKVTGLPMMLLTMIFEMNVTTLLTQTRIYINKALQRNKFKLPRNLYVAYYANIIVARKMNLLLSSKLLTKIS